MVQAGLCRRRPRPGIPRERRADSRSLACERKELMIKAIGHVGLQVPNLDESVRWATTVMGLREVERDNGAAYLTHGGVHHSLLYIQAGQAALDHIALEAQDENSMHELRERLAKHGVKIVSERPEELGIKHAIRFLGPAGHVFEVFTEMAGAEPRHTGSGVQPRKVGHPLLQCEGKR